MGEWRQVRIEDFLHRTKSPVSLRDDEAYQLVTVRMHHKGVTLREKKKGKLIGSNMYRVKSGQFILSGIDARHGAFGVIPEELDGAIVTNDFWYFDVDDAVVSRDFFLWFTSTPLFLDACIKSSEGTTNRRRLQAERFFNFSFNFPGISEQHRLAERFIAFDKTHSALKDEFEIQTTHFKQLRQAVLQEAVEGKLTADWRRQNTDPIPHLTSPLKGEEPDLLPPLQGEGRGGDGFKGNPLYDASALLAQIKAEKERLVKAGKIGKEKPLPPIADSDKPFELPVGWVWCQLGEIAESLCYGTSQKCDYDSKRSAKVLRIPNVSSGIIDVEDLKYADLPTNELNDLALRDKDVLIIRSNGSRELVGRMVIASSEHEGYAYAGYLIRLRFTEKSTLPTYIQICSASSLVRDQIEIPLRTTVGINNINTTEISALKFPLPPLAEQQAIVARVDSLMTTIDALEAQVTERKEQAQLLMQAVLREAFVGGEINRLVYEL